MIRHDLQPSEKSKYFSKWMKYAGTLKLSKAEQVKRIREYTGHDTIADCSAADLRKLLVGLGINPDDQGAMT